MGTPVNHQALYASIGTTVTNIPPQERGMSKQNGTISSVTHNGILLLPFVNTVGGNLAIPLLNFSCVLFGSRCLNDILVLQRAPFFIWIAEKARLLVLKVGEIDRHPCDPNGHTRFFFAVADRKKSKH